MQTFIALFRGINVGGNNILPMKSLVDVLEAHGFEDVKTYIQSGNVVFKTASASSGDIAELVKNEFGFAPKVMLLSVDDLQSALSNCPYLEVDGESVEGKSVHFYFCESEPELGSLGSEKLESLCAESEQYSLIGSVFYLYAPDGIGRSKLAAKVEGCLGVGLTARNLNTVRKVLDLSEV